MKIFFVSCSLFILCLPYLAHFSYSLNNSLNNAITNSTNLTLPSNTSRIEAILNNDPSNENSDQTNQLYGLITTAMGGGLAISGSIVATYLTSYYARKKQIEEEKKFNSRIRMLVQSELQNYLNFISSFKVDDIISKEVLAAFITFSKEYKNMSLEKRATIFSPEALSDIEQAYNFFDIFVSYVKSALENRPAEVSFRDLNELLDIDFLKEKLAFAIVAIKKDQKKELT